MSDSYPKSEYAEVEETEYSTVEEGAMWRLKLSNGLILWFNIGGQFIPAPGDELLVVMPNSTDVWVHFHMGSRVYPYKFTRGKFCLPLVA